MSDRHKTPRLYKSGAQKIKLAADQKKNSEESLSSIPKLTNYFATSRLLVTNSSSQLTKDLVTNVVDISSNESEFDDNLDGQSQNESVDNNTESVSELGFENDIGPLTKNVVTNVVDTSKNDPEFVENLEEQFPKNESIDNNTESVPKLGFENVIGLWPNKYTKEIISFWIKKGFNDLQNCDEKLFEKSSVNQDRCERPDHGTRKCSINFFKRISKNKEIVNRFWLCFSPSTGKIYCYVCKLLETNQGNLSNNGYCDWKHASERLRQHEASKEHLQTIIILSQRGKEIGCIDKSLKQQMNEESGYWNKILMRVVSTIKFISERGLALRG